METSGLSYEEVFSEASELGYLESDPNLDIGGIDALTNFQYCHQLPLAQR